jgi:hypothetical protein
MRSATPAVVAALGLLLPAASALAQDKKAPEPDPPGLIGRIDLMTAEGVAAVKGEWRYAPVTTGVGEKKNDIEPKAHGAFDDSKWELVDPPTLKKPRGVGKYCWCWYRIKVTIPDKVGDKPFSGGPVWFQTIVDDYGEIWVDGKIDLAFGKSGRGAVSGFNTRNRVRLTKGETVEDEKTKKKKTVQRDPKPGEVFQIAVLGINSPLGNPPGNFIFLRAPTGLDFFERGAPNAGADVPPASEPPEGRPATRKAAATIDLLKKEGVELVQGAWRRHLVTVHTGEMKNEIEPKAHGAFDDSAWEIADPTALPKPFGPGKFSMAWYRINVTIPERVGDVPTEGTAVWFRTTVDDYGEIWVNGQIDRNFGRSGRGAISGFNTQNNVLLSKSAKPGEKIQIAVLAINSPFGNPPGNFIFFRSPTDIRFFKE